MHLVNLVIHSFNVKTETVIVSKELSQLNELDNLMSVILNPKAVLCYHVTLRDKSCCVNILNLFTNKSNKISNIFSWENFQMQYI